MHAAKNCGPAREYGTADAIQDITEDPNLIAPRRSVKGLCRSANNRAGGRHA